MPKFQLDEWQIDSQAGTFCKGEHCVHVEPKIMDVLLRLVDSSGQVVSRDALLESVWGDVIVSEEALTRCISELRTLLGDTERQRKYIRTVPKRGYALMLDVQWLDNSGAIKLEVKEDIVVPKAPSVHSNDPRWMFGSVFMAAITAYLLFLTFGPVNTAGLPEAAVSPVVNKEEATLVISPGDTRPSLAVLPFSNLSPASEHRYAAEALTEDLRNDLTRTNALRVAARTSSLVFRDQVLDIREIGRLLNVRHLVEGSVRVEGENLRITVQLTDAASGYQLWSQVFERPQQELRGLDIEIAESLMTQIVPPEVAVSISKTEQAQDSEAYSQYLLGRYYSYQSTSETTAKAIEHYQAAIDLDPNFGRAYGGLAQLYMDQIKIGKGHMSGEFDTKVKEQVLSGVEPLLKQAVLLAPESGEVLAASARYARLQGDVDEAIVTYQLALSANPAMPMVRLALGKLLIDKQEVNLAYQQYATALQTDPLHPNIQKGFLWALMAKGEYVEAIRYSSQFFEQSKDESLLKIALTSYVSTGQYDKALLFAQRYNFSPELEQIATYRVVESLYFLQRFEDADKLRAQAGDKIDGFSQASLEANKGVSLRDADIVYRAADMLQAQESEVGDMGMNCIMPFADYWRGYGAYIERDYDSAIKYFDKADQSGFESCASSPDVKVSFSLYYSHALQLVGDRRSIVWLSKTREQLGNFSARGWGGSRLGLYNIASNLLNGRDSEANRELIKLRAQDIEPFGMIFAEPIFDDFYGNDTIEPTMTLVRLDFEETRRRCEEQQLVKFGL